MNYCICVSGNLGLTVLKCLNDGFLDISCVLTDKSSDNIVEYAQKENIPVFKGNPRNGKAAVWLDEANISFDNIISVNYLFILEPDILDRVKNVAVNFHGSLLPKYRGRTPHVWAIINGEKEAGITAHLMNSKCDDGDIVKQIVVPIGENETGADILVKYNSIYPGLVKSIISDIEGNTLKHTPQDTTKATYFGKRTPADGKINWDWQKERIRNWVRAQAFPYPGAFALFKGNKIIINKVEYSDIGFTDKMDNGLVISVIEGIPYVKTPNGVIKLLGIEADVEIKSGVILT